MRWLDEIVTKFNQGYGAFILTGNVNDHFPQPRSRKRKPKVLLLADVLFQHVQKLKSFRSPQKRLFVRFDMGRGFTFPDPADEHSGRFIACLKRTQSEELDAPISADTVPTPKHAYEALQWISRVLEVATERSLHCAIVISDIDGIAPFHPIPNENSVYNALAIVQLAQQCALNIGQHCVIMTASSLASVHERLRRPDSDIALVEVTKPLEEERSSWLQSICRAKLYAMPAMGVESLARQTQGFTYRDLQRLLRGAHSEGKALCDVDLVESRLHILRRSYGELLDVVVPAYGFEGIAGYQTIKSFLLSVRDAIRKGDLRRVPMGCMLMGPPGTGKTAIAEAFARECGYIFLKVRNLLNMFVGSSEANNERMLMALRELAPAIVLRDEVDEEDSGRQGYQGDSGVSGRIRRMWMQFLSDSTIRGRVFVISCTNRPDRLDAALKRSGRTDERIPMLMPDHQTRTQLFPVMIQRYQFPCAEHIDWSIHATETKNFSGADIEVIVRRAYDFATQDGGIITGKCVHHAIEDFIPSASQAEIARMTLLAIQETSSKRFLPHDWSELVAEAKA